MTTHPADHSINPRVRVRAGVLLIAIPTAFMIFFTALQIRFDYPDILRKPAAEVLTRFADIQPSLLPLWYGMFASAILFIPLSITVASLCPASRSRNVSLITFGVLAGLVQSIGLARWVFAVPVLATKYAATTSEHEKFALTTTFDTLNALLGMGIGEHLGYLFTATWTLILTTIIRPTRPITAAVGMLSALGIAAGLLEPAGIPSAATINALGYTFWSLWLIWLGILVLARKPVFADRSH